MQFGFGAPVSGPLSGPRDLARIASGGEALGYDYCTISDHVMIPRDMEAKYPYSDTGEFPGRAGVGWCKEEFDAVGTEPFEERGAVTDETIAVCRELWSNENPSFSGKYAKFSNVFFQPRPVQKRVPIWVGGESGPAMRRTAKLADAWYPLGTNPKHRLDTLARLQAGLERLHRMTRAAGRNPSDVGL